jgi:hypothetical protein
LAARKLSVQKAATLPVVLIDAEVSPAGKRFVFQLTLSLG